MELGRPRAAAGGPRAGGRRAAAAPPRPAPPGQDPASRAATRAAAAGLSSKLARDRATASARGRGMTCSTCASAPSEKASRSGGARAWMRARTEQAWTKAGMSAAAPAAAARSAAWMAGWTAPAALALAFVWV